MKKIKFGYLNGNEKEVVREVEVTNEDLNIVLTLQRYTETNRNFYEAYDNVIHRYKFIEIV